MSKLTTNALTTGAIMAALVVIFGLMSLLPVIGSVALLIAAVPLSVMCVRYGLKGSVLSGITAAVLIGLLGGITSALTAVLRILPLGIIAGIMLKKRKNAMLTFMVAAVTAALGVLATFLVNMWLMGISLAEISQTIFMPFEDIVAIYDSMGLIAVFEAQGMDLSALESIYEQMVNFFTTLLPVMVLFIGALIGGIHCLVSITLSKRLGFKMRKFPRFSKWYLPTWSIYGLILALLALVCKDYLPYPWLDKLVLNLLFFYMIILYIIGLAVIAHLLNIHKQSKGMKALWVAGVIFVSLSNFSLLIALLGAFDILLDFRHIHPTDQYLPKFLTKKTAQVKPQAEQKPPRKKIRRDK